MVLWRGNDSHEEDKGFVYLFLFNYIIYSFLILFYMRRVVSERGRGRELFL